MIARSWDGEVPQARAEEYHQYLLRTGVPDLRATPGNRGVYVLRRVGAGVASFRLISLWESLDSIRAFAGDPIDRARYYPEDAEYLLELAPTCVHYEVLVEPDERRVRAAL